MDGKGGFFACLFVYLFCFALLRGKWKVNGGMEALSRHVWTSQKFSKALPMSKSNFSSYSLMKKSTRI